MKAPRNLSRIRFAVVLCSSSQTLHTFEKRKIKFGDIYDVYERDKDRGPFKLTKLTKDHVSLGNPSLKMRSHLASQIFRLDVIDELTSHGGISTQATRLYLDKCRVLKNIIFSRNPISSLDDPRFKQGYDMLLCVRGLFGLARAMIPLGIFIVPKSISQDCVENWFSLHRMASNNSNPSVYEYRVQNIINMQVVDFATLSTKSNTRGKTYILEDSEPLERRTSVETTRISDASILNKITYIIGYLDRGYAEPN